MVRVALLGAGGIGGWLGARLLESKAADVVLIARGAHGDAIRASGLRLQIEGPAPELLNCHGAEVYASVEDAIGKGAALVDFVIIGVKTWQVKEAAAEVAPLLSPTGCAVTTQNGIEAVEDAAGVLGHERVLGGVCKVLAFIAEPGLVQMRLPGPHSFHFGEVYDEQGRPTQEASSKRVQELAVVFAQCQGVESGIAAPSTWTVIWEKAIIMCSIGPLGALCRAPLDVLYATPATKQLLKAAMLEVVACGRAAGHLSEAAEAKVETFLEAFGNSPPGSTPSTLRDVLAGRPSELHELTGAVQRAGLSLGVPTPAHDFIFAALLPQERRARGEGPYTLVGVPGGSPNIPS